MMLIVEQTVHVKLFLKYRLFVHTETNNIILPFFEHFWEGVDSPHMCIKC